MGKRGSGRRSGLRKLISRVYRVLGMVNTAEHAVSKPGGLLRHMIRKAIVKRGGRMV